MYHNGDHSVLELGNDIYEVKAVELQTAEDGTVTAQITATLVPGKDYSQMTRVHNTDGVTHQYHHVTATTAVKPTVPKPTIVQKPASSTK